MGKNKKSFWKSSLKYLRELSIVITGIAVTFYIGNRISSHNEQKDIRSSLELVKMELEDNLLIVQEQFEFYDQTGKFAKYLLYSSNRESLHADSLAKYDHVIRDIKFMVYKTSAFEMLKSSGAMRLIKDKELLKSIIDCYNLMEYARYVGDKEMAMKEAEVRNAVAENGISNVIFEFKTPKRLFNYFSTYTATEGRFRECEQQIEKTIKLL